MSRLIYNPAVFRFTKLELDWDEIYAWLEYNGYKPTVEKRLYDLLQDMADRKVSVADGLSELCARFCYRAFKGGRPTEEHIHHIIESGHGSVFAHINLTLSIQGVSRTLTHELIRHHVGVNPSQESQRYVDAKDINFVVPPLIHWAWNADTARNQAPDDQGPSRFNVHANEWLNKQLAKVEDYLDEQRFLKDMLAQANPFDDGEKLKKRINEAARCHLPGCAETRLTWTMNLRAARDILGNPSKRGSEGADLEIRRLALYMLAHFQQAAPVVFADFEVVDMPVVPGIKSKFGGV